ncbi:MAG: hypothetical protein AMJ90_04695 [candidate division Zixibacteria bacterium SM23_73_2]|nr:MAG: hypothetical protein AMJ90_04695 [candidate division Zixibacteria bacterium SM23_73_2]
MSLLDEKKLLGKFDPGGMYKKILNFPSQLEDALKIAESADISEIDTGKINNIIVAGMGGSAIGGDLVRSYLFDQVKLPFYVCRNYFLPNSVNENSLVFVSSYSGNTEETLSAYDQAKKKKAQILCLSSGGRLEKKAKEDGFSLIKIPTGYQPRAALGYSFVPVLWILSKLGFCSDKRGDIQKTVDFLSENASLYAWETKTQDNLAKKLAEKIMGKLPIIYSSNDFFDVVAYRWKGQLCENSKVLAYSNVFPEFNHNELVGWNILSGLEDKLIVIILKDEGDYLRIEKRMGIVKIIIQDKKVEVVEVESKGTNLLSRIFSLIQLGDFVSLYLAILNRTDPTPVKIIDYLKKELQKD